MRQDQGIIFYSGILPHALDSDVNICTLGFNTYVMYNYFVVLYVGLWEFIKSVYRAFQVVVFDSGQKMALKSLTYYCINRSHRHILAVIENNWFRVPIYDI